MEATSEQTRVRVLEDAEPAVEKLFVYGIFLDEANRQYYGMENPSYDTVQGFITIGSHIVKAIPSPIIGASLTGLLVDIPSRKFPALDALEAGYDRIKVNTTGGFEAFMYATPGVSENYSNIRNSYYEQSESDEEQEHMPF